MEGIEEIAHLVLSPPLGPIYFLIVSSGLEWEVENGVVWD